MTWLRHTSTLKPERSFDDVKRKGGKKGKRGGSDKYDRKYEDRKEGEDGVEDYWFVCNRWFAKSEDDGMIVRELMLTDERGIPLDPRYKGAKKN